MKHEPKEIEAVDTELPSNRRYRDDNRVVERPYNDASNLYNIPQVRPDDPPMRRWWIDDEPQD